MLCLLEIPGLGYAIDVNTALLTPATTIADLVASFARVQLDAGIDCGQCQSNKSCCAQGWRVVAEAPTIAYLTALGLSDCLDYNGGATCLINRGKRCALLDAADRCRAYSARPLTCQMFVCLYISNRCRVVRDLVVLASGESSFNVQAKELITVANPIFHYPPGAAPLLEVLRYAHKWLSPEYANEYATLFTS